MPCQLPVIESWFHKGGLVVVYLSGNQSFVLQFRLTKQYDQYEVKVGQRAGA